MMPKAPPLDPATLEYAAEVCQKHAAYFHAKSDKADSDLLKIAFSGSEAGAILCGETFTALAIQAQIEANNAPQPR